jgi:hypothetical protein
MPGQPEEGAGETFMTTSKDEIVAEATRIVDSISINDPN